jgi:hypothetical protein
MGTKNKSPKLNNKFNDSLDNNHLKDDKAQAHIRASQERRKQ